MSIKQTIQDELLKHPPEQRIVLAQMMKDKLTGTKTSKNDYKKLIKIQKKMKTRRLKSEKQNRTSKI